MHRLTSAVATVLAFALLVFPPMQVLAADSPPTCYTQAQLEADTKGAAESAHNADIRIVGGAEYDGLLSDAVVFVRGGTEILAFLFKNGCMIGVQPVDGVKPKVGA